MTKTYEELLEENKLLRRKISPLEDPDFTRHLEHKMKGLDLSKFRRNFRDGEYIVLYPNEFYELAFGEEGNTRDITDLGRSLQALLWERSAIIGKLCFVKEVSEYERTKV